MTTIELDPSDITDNGTHDETVEAEDNLASALSAAFTISAEQFTAMKAADRETAIFLLVREMAATLLSMELRLNEYEAKAQALASPEGINELMQKFMGGGATGGKGLNMGSLLKGMI